MAVIQQFEKTFPIILMSSAWPSKVSLSQLRMKLSTTSEKDMRKRGARSMNVRCSVDGCVSAMSRFRITKGTLTIASHPRWWRGRRNPSTRFWVVEYPMIFHLFGVKPTVSARPMQSSVVIPKFWEFKIFAIESRKAIVTSDALWKALCIFM